MFSHRLIPIRRLFARLSGCSATVLFLCAVLIPALTQGQSVPEIGYETASITDSASTSVAGPSTAGNSATAYLSLGSATTVNRFNYGFAGQADFRLSPRVALQGGIRLANQYPSGLGDLKLGVVVTPSKRSPQWRIENVFCFSNYSPYPMSQFYYLLTGVWEIKHFRIDFGNAFAFFMGSGVVKAHLWRPSFNLRGTFRTDDKLWNAALFIRNFNRFEAHGSRAMEWGGELSARIGGRWRIFCEPYVVTVGNFNGTATFYNFNCLIGGSFQW